MLRLELQLLCFFLSQKMNHLDEANFCPIDINHLVNPLLVFPETGSWYLYLIIFFIKEQMRVKSSGMKKLISW